MGQELFCKSHVNMPPLTSAVQLITEAYEVLSDGGLSSREGVGGAWSMQCGEENLGHPSPLFCAEHSPHSPTSSLQTNRGRHTGVLAPTPPLHPRTAEAAMEVRTVRAMGTPMATQAAMPTDMGGRRIVSVSEPMRGVEV